MWTSIPAWVSKKPILYSIILSLIIVLFAAEKAEFIWALFYSEPMVPKVREWIENIKVLPDWLALLGVIISLCFVFLIWWNTRSNKNSQILNPETRASEPEQNTAQRIEDILSVEIGGHKVSRNFVTKLITIGYPKNVASEPYLSWWHVPVCLNKITDSPILSLDHCSVYLDVTGVNKMKLRWTSDRPGGDSEASLRIGEEPKLVPIVARTETTLPWLPAI